MASDSSRHFSDCLLHDERDVHQNWTEFQENRGIKCVSYDVKEQK